MLYIEKLIFTWRRVENIVGKGEKAGCPYFLPLRQCFLKAFSGWLKPGNMLQRIDRILFVTYFRSNKMLFFV